MDENENKQEETITVNNVTMPAPKQTQFKIENCNAMTIWGILFIAICGSIGLCICVSGNLAIGVSITISGVVIGMILLGISAIVARLNEIIKMMRENKQ